VVTSLFLVMCARLVIVSRQNLDPVHSCNYGLLFAFTVENSPAMVTPTLNDLKAFAAVAAHRNFRKAADELGLSPSSLSHVVRTLERNLDVRLLNRTTRSVAPTEIGERLLFRLGPILRDLQTTFDEVASLGALPSGTLRINANEGAARLLLRRAVPTFLGRYPGISLDLVTEGRLVDIVAEGFDAGVRLGEALAQHDSRSLRRRCSLPGRRVAGLSLQPQGSSGT
jgi:DNA-binding transcriptional LysR family regulator